jgi:hypothetical protein
VVLCICVVFIRVESVYVCYFYVKWNITFMVRYCKVVLRDRARGSKRALCCDGKQRTE